MEGVRGEIYIYVYIYKIIMVNVEMFDWNPVFGEKFFFKINMIFKILK